jgi:hypothetical protein
MSDNGHEPYAYNPFVSDMTARQQARHYEECYVTAQANSLAQQQGHQKLNTYPMQWTEAELDILRARGKPPPTATNKIVAAHTPGLDSTDALLEAVREMTLQVTALRTLITALREHMGDKPSVVAFPGNALRHSR